HYKLKASSQAKNTYRGDRSLKTIKNVTRNKTVSFSHANYSNHEWTGRDDSVPVPSPCIWSDDYQNIPEGVPSWSAYQSLDLALIRQFDSLTALSHASFQQLRYSFRCVKSRRLPPC